MKDKGFTLIELLAVIVILTIIALIATPLILNVIEDSRKKAFIESVRNSLNALEIYSLSATFPKFEDKIFLEIDIKDKNLSISKKDFKNGSLIFHKNNKLEANNVVSNSGKYCVKGEYEKLKISNDGDCSKLDTTPPELDNISMTNIATSSISIALAARDNESGISAYYFRITKDGENFSQWVKVTDSNTYTFNNLNPNTNYKIEATAENSIGMKQDTPLNLTTKTKDIPLTIPVIDISKSGWNDPSWTNKDVLATINFQKNTEASNKYSIDNGDTFTEVTDEKVTLSIQDNTTIIAITESISNPTIKEISSFTINSIDKIKPTCSNIGGNPSWSNKKVTITGICNDLGGSGCNGNITRDYTNNTNITNAGPGDVTDKAGNKTTCSTDQIVKIDITPPDCSTRGGNNDWVNKNVTITGQCHDSGSGCTGDATKVYSTNTNINNAGPGDVYDNAGNKTTCQAEQTVKIDKTPPTCVSRGGNPLWTPNDITLTGTCNDSGGSGCKGNVSQLFSAKWGNNNLTTASPGDVYDNAGNKTICPANQTVKTFYIGDETSSTILTATGGSKKIPIYHDPSNQSLTVFDDRNPIKNIFAGTFVVNQSLNGACWNLANNMQPATPIKLPTLTIPSTEYIIYTANDYNNYKAMFLEKCKKEGWNYGMFSSISIESLLYTFNGQSMYIPFT